MNYNYFSEECYMHHDKLWKGFKPNPMFQHTDCGMFWEEDCEHCGELIFLDTNRLSILINYVTENYM